MIEPFERPLQVDTAEGARHRALVPVLRARRQQDRPEREGHQHVPLPPRRVPASCRTRSPPSPRPGARTPPRSRAAGSGDAGHTAGGTGPRRSRRARSRPATAAGGSAPASSPGVPRERLDLGERRDRPGPRSRSAAAERSHRCVRGPSLVSALLVGQCRGGSEDPRPTTRPTGVAMTNPSFGVARRTFGVASAWRAQEPRARRAWPARPGTSAHRSR